MTPIKKALPMAALLAVLAAATAAAQQMPRSKPVPPDTIPPKSASTETIRSATADVEKTWDKTKAMTRKEWHAAKRKWATERVKWRACNHQAEAEKLAAPKSWRFVADCMTRS